MDRQQTAQSTETSESESSEAAQVDPATGRDFRLRAADEDFFQGAASEWSVCHPDVARFERILGDLCRVRAGEMMVQNGRGCSTSRLQEVCLQPTAGTRRLSVAFGWLNKLATLVLKDSCYVQSKDVERPWAPRGSTSPSRDWQIVSSAW